MIKTNYKEILPGVLEVDLPEYNNEIIGKVRKDLFSKKTHLGALNQALQFFICINII